MSLMVIPCFAMVTLGRKRVADRKRKKYDCVGHGNSNCMYVSYLLLVKLKDWSDCIHPGEKELKDGFFNLQQRDLIVKS